LRIRQVLWLVAIVVSTTAPVCDPPENSFVWDVTPGGGVDVEPGDAAVFDIVVESKRNINSRVLLRVEADDPLPPEVTLTLDPEVLGATDDRGTLTVRTTTDTPVRRYVLRIYAMEEGAEETNTSVVLFVRPAGEEPDFSLVVDPSEIELDVNDRGRLNEGVFYHITRLNGFDATIEITVTVSDPIKVGNRPNPARFEVEGQAFEHNGNFSIYVDPSLPIESPIEITVRAASTSVVHEATILVTILGGTTTAPGG
jgi:hypothetical protein